MHTFFSCRPAAYNDYQMHTFCMTYHGLLGQFMLPPTCLMASGKLVALDALLKELKTAGSRPLIFSQVRAGRSCQCRPLVLVV
jgi:hypothetical protein